MESRRALVAPNYLGCVKFGMRGQKQKNILDQPDFEIKDVSGVESVAKELGGDLDPEDGRHIEIVATGLPLHQGIPLAVDATIVSPLQADGQPHPHADERPGVALGRGRHSKETTYPELLESSRLRLLTAGVETGGRLSKEALHLLDELASFRARSEPPALQGIIARSWRARWTVMLSVACQNALAATLVDDGVSFLDGVSTGSPLGIDVWLDAA